MLPDATKTQIYMNIYHLPLIVKVPVDDTREMMAASVAGNKLARLSKQELK
jgi:hypothetical protein